MGVVGVSWGDAAFGRTGSGKRAVRRIRIASLPSAAGARGMATAIQIQPIWSPGNARVISSVPGTLPLRRCANGVSGQSGNAPPSDGRTRRQAGARDPHSSISTASSRPARSVSVRSHFTPRSETRTSDTASTGWAVNATRWPEARSVGSVHEDSRMPPGRTCRVSVARRALRVRHSVVRAPGRQWLAGGWEWRSHGELSAASRTSPPASSSSPTEKHGPTSWCSR